MFTSIIVLEALAWLFVVPIVVGVLGLVGRIMGGALRLVFSLLGVLMLPVVLFAMAMGGLVWAARIAAPFLIAWLLWSLFTTDPEY